MRRHKSFFWALFSNIFGFLFFIFLLFMANLFMPAINNPVFSKIVLFLNSNIVLIIVISFMHLVSDLFAALIFPFNIPYPVFVAFSGMFTLTFLFRIFVLVEEIINAQIFNVFKPFAFLLYPLLFIIIIISGYIHIFSRLFMWEEEYEEKRKMRREERKMRRKKMKGKRTWEDVGDEWRNLMYDVASILREAIKPKGKKKRRK